VRPERQGDFNAIACAIVCGLGNIIVKIGLTDVTTELFTFWMFAAAFVISVIAMLNGKIRREVLTTDLKTVGLISLLTIFFSFGIYTSYQALKLIEPATVSFLSRFEIILTLVFAYFFLKERLTGYELFGALVAVAGVFILKYRTTLEISRAATLMILSACFFAASEIVVKKYIRMMGTMRFVFIRNVIAVGVFFLILLIVGQPMTVPDGPTLLWAFLGALLLPILGRVTYIEALKRINISRAAIFTQATPLFTAMFALIILRTIPTPIEWLGGFLIVAGVLIVKLTEKMNFKRRPAY
jgi:drug/metabolite transporter (DMT)-like permease